MEDDTNHCQGPLVRDMHGPQDLEYNSAPFHYLSKVLKYCPVSEKHTVRVKAYIATLSRPDPKSSKWNVTVKLNDGTATVDADLSEKVLTELLEYPVDKYRREIQEAMRNRNQLCVKDYTRERNYSKETLPRRLG
ncbi:recQ-mediated genome instability protein 1 [Desmophyllum pertusum]|uniref:RecQ-mediated genome instability protein 1 n=1 Tax=Desmophyllum pertusum TaxID=174260 RepID=A0A9X0A6F0_9CNID|nr:recQ-mediated genome instability protein 1 [Desmophyllum pertusum]